MKLKIPSLLLFFLSNLFVPFSLAQKNVCISQGGRFPPFPNPGQTPRKAPKGPRDLTLCRLFKHNTCCDITQTFPASISVRKLASTGEAGAECLQLWELLECSVCDPNVGTRAGPPVVCAEFCERVFEACGGAYFSLDMKTQILSPCGLNDIVCGKLREWASNGTELCSLTGFSVQKHNEDSDGFCYGGKESLGSISDSWKLDRRGPAFNAQTGLFKDVEISERVSWAIGGLVLTAGLIYMSKRKSYNRRQRQVGVNRVVRKLETRSRVSSSLVK
ncbi:hypothetical protein LUZ60_015857 [Juncus effusus]|nr:hypothetical protein LUZ60_015857 [Juncus effusus]